VNGAEGVLVGVALTVAVLLVAGRPAGWRATVAGGVPRVRPRCTP
jgi:hypothetical protein